MGKYLKLFANHTAYDAVKNNLDKPNVSYCLQENEIHYNPWVDPRLIIMYEVIDDTNPTLLYTYINESGFEVTAAVMFDKVEIDNAEISISSLDTAQGQYQLSNGTHIVKYTLKDPTTMGATGDFGSMTFGAIFLLCGNVKSVIIPNSVTTIGNSTFSGCIRLNLVTIPDSVTIIDDSSFYGTGITSINIPNSVTSIGKFAFSLCDDLTSVTIPSSVVSVGELAFAYCSSLTNLTIDTNGMVDEDTIFESCENIKRIKIGSNVRTIEIYNFTYSANIESIIVDSNNSVYDSRNNCNAIIETSTNKLLKGCKNTIIPNTITSILCNAFYNCTNLTNITIPNSVTTIEGSAFAECNSLSSIIISNSVTSIGNETFANCSSLTNITSLATIAPTIQYDTFQNIKTGGTLTVPSGSSGYDVWMGTGDYYLGKYNWTKVEL